MAKHITAQIKKVVGFDKGMIRILAQTHRNGSFGEDGRNYFVASNGVTLISNKFPSREASKATKQDLNTLYVRGTSTDKDNNAVAFPVTRLAKIEAAIKEYNVYFSDAKINERYWAKREAEAAARRAEEVRQAELRRQAAAKAEAERLARLNACTYIID